MKQAEFLNLDTKQVQWFDASLEHPNLVKVPDGAEIAIEFNDDPDGFGVIFYKNDGKTSASEDGGFIWKNGSLWSMKDLLDPEFKEGGIDLSPSILWQRQTHLRQKVDEAKQKLKMNERQLSKAIGREESYITKMFVGSRNPRAKTIEALIADLDRLMNQKPKPEDVLKTVTVQLSIDTKEVQEELKKAYGLVDQANNNALMWQKKYNDQRNLSWFLTLVVMVMALVWIYSVWGV